MMVVNKNNIFEHWLAEYGTHLEELAAARLSGDPQQAGMPQLLREPQIKEEQEH